MAAMASLRLWEPSRKNTLKAFHKRVCQRKGERGRDEGREAKREERERGGREGEWRGRGEERKRERFITSTSFPSLFYIVVYYSRVTHLLTLH